MRGKVGNIRSDKRRKMGQGQVARFGINNALKPDLIINLYKYYSTKASEQANFLWSL